jgi:hypothetical protein
MDVSVGGMNGRKSVLSLAMAMASPDHLVVQLQAAADVSGWEGELSCEPDVEGKALGPDDLGRLWKAKAYFCGHIFGPAQPHVRAITWRINSPGAASCAR